jgi:hypothetical protein
MSKFITAGSKVNFNQEVYQKVLPMMRERASDTVDNTTLFER